MPFKSEAQRRKFAEMLKDGKITQEVYDGFHADTGHQKLPERAPSKPPKTLKPMKKAKVIR